MTDLQQLSPFDRYLDKFRGQRDIYEDNIKPQAIALEKNLPSIVTDNIIVDFIREN